MCSFGRNSVQKPAGTARMGGVHSMGRGDHGR